jgi:hypothetical protein
MRIFKTPRYANVTSTLALVVALGGTAYGGITVSGSNIKPHSITEQQMAAGAIGSKEIQQHSIAEQDMKANSVGAAELKALSVAAGDIKANAVGSEQIKAGAVAASDIKAGAIGATALQTAAVAAAIQTQLGATGAPGAQGAPGAAGSAIAYARVNADGTIDPGDSKNIELVSAGGGIYCLNYTAGTPHVVLRPTCRAPTAARTRRSSRPKAWPTPARPEPTSGCDGLDPADAQRPAPVLPGRHRVATVAAVEWGRRIPAPVSGPTLDNR